MTDPTRRSATRMTLLATTLATVFAVASPLATADRAPGPANDQFIVRFKDGTAEFSHATQRQQRLDAAGRAQGLRLGQQRRLAVGADVVRSNRPLDADESRALLARLRSDPRVAYAEIDARVYPAFTPDDPRYAEQWHYFEPTAGINVPGAWDVTRGEGEVVAVIDTGMTWHPDLIDNLLPGYDFITDPATASDGDGRDDNASDPGDFTANGQCSPTWSGRMSSWHGTHVAGTIAAVSDNALGVAGVAHGAKVQPVRVLGRCGGVTSDINDAIVWASGGTIDGIPDNPTPASVINLSLGGAGACLESTEAAIDAAVANGATVVVAAGNNNADAAGYQPASCTNIVTVAAVGRAGARASYSNFGADVDIAAPGGDGTDSVLSTHNFGPTYPDLPSYAGMKGTSMAAPHVAGVAALVQAASGGTLSPADMKAVLEASARPLPVACSEGCGAGLLDATAAVLAGAKPFLLVAAPVASDEGSSGSHDIVFHVKLMQALPTDVTFDIATVDGTAEGGSDFIARSETAQVIPAGSTQYDFAVTVLGDATPELDERFTVELANVSGDVTGMRGTAAARINDDDPFVLTGNVPMTIADAEPGHLRYFTVEVPEHAVGLKFSLENGTGNGDLWARYGQRPTTTAYDCSSTWSATSEQCWPPTGPSATEAKAGTWYVMVRATTAYSDVALTASYTELPGLSISDASITEGDGGTLKKMTFTVSLSKATNSFVMFDAMTEHGTTNGSDFFPTWVSQAQIPAGQLSKTVTVDIMGDTTMEPDETFFVKLSQVSGAYVADASGTGTILDDDTPKLSIADVFTTEGNTGTKAMTFVVKLSKAASTAVTYDIATSDLTAIAGEDYVAAALTGRTIPAGQVAQAFTVTLNGDTTLEDNEFLLVDVANASVPVADGQAVGVIQNDEGPTLSINDAGYQEGNSGQKTLTFTISLSQVSAVPVTFTLATGGGTATSGIDYTGIAPRTVTIPAGSLSRQILVYTQGDTAIEGNETFFVTLSNASVSMTDSQGRGSLINDDGPTLSIRDAASVRQGPPGSITWMTFVVELSQPMAKPATFNLSTADGTALAGSDYQATSLSGATIPAGQTSMTFSVGIHGLAAGDAMFETFQVNLSMGNVSIVDGVGTGRIQR